MARILIAGCGYVGSEVARRLVAGGHDVWGLRRRPDGLPPGVIPVAADLGRWPLPELPAELDAVVYAASSDGFEPEAYRRAYFDGPRHLLRALATAAPPPDRFVFTSSTSVYGDAGGAWVDESAPTAPSRWSGELLLEAEAQVLESPLVRPTAVRLAGLYGPGRLLLVDRLRRGEATCVEDPPQWLNLLHRDDAATAVVHLLGLETPPRLALAVDDEPTTRCAVMRWLAERLELPPPRVVDADAADRRRGGAKRCRATALRASGWRPRFPSFKVGYEAVLSGSGAG